jgi:hypothetical protein
MVEETNSSINNIDIDPELEYLKQKSAKGTMNVIGDVLSNPEIKKIIMRKVTMPIVAVFCLFIGVLGVFDVAKLVLGINWQVETVISIILLTIGLSYLIKNVFIGKKHAN